MDRKVERSKPRTMSADAEEMREAEEEAIGAE